jgi:hypothetical protein
MKANIRAQKKIVAGAKPLRWKGCQGLLLGIRHHWGSPGTVVCNIRVQDVNTSRIGFGLINTSPSYCVKELSNRQITFLVPYLPLPPT